MFITEDYIPAHQRQQEAHLLFQPDSRRLFNRPQTPPHPVVAAVSNKPDMTSHDTGKPRIWSIADVATTTAATSSSSAACSAGPPSWNSSPPSLFSHQHPGLFPFPPALLQQWRKTQLQQSQLYLHRQRPHQSSSTIEHFPASVTTSSSLSSSIPPPLLSAASAAPIVNFNFTPLPPPGAASFLHLSSRQHHLHPHLLSSPSSLGLLSSAAGHLQQSVVQAPS